MFEPTYGNRNAMIEAARSAIQVGDFALAEDSLKSLLRADPDDAEAASLLASAVARNMSEVRAIAAQRSPAFPSSAFNALWLRRIDPPRSLFYWLCAVGFFLGGLAELRFSLPLMLAQGPNATYTYISKTGYPLSEPVGYAVGEGSVFVFVAVTFAAVAVSFRRREAHRRRHGKC